MALRSSRDRGRSHLFRPHPVLLDLARGTPSVQIVLSEDLLASAVTHRMYGLLWSAVSAAPSQSNSDLRERLQQMDVATWLHHSLLWDSITRLGQKLDPLGVSYAVVKGVVAERRWYGRIGDRPAADLDVLLAPSSLGRIDEVVAAIDPSHPLLGRIETLITAGLLQSVNLDFARVVVDLHTDLFELGIPAGGAQLVWGMMEPGEIDDAPAVLVPNAALTLVHFLVHANRDRFRRLLGMVDVLRVLESGLVDWELVRRLTQATGLGPLVTSALRAIEHDLGMNSQSPMRREGSVRSKMWRFAWRPSVRLQGEQARYRYSWRTQWLLPMLKRGGVVPTLVMALRRVFPPGALIAYRHPHSRGPYLIRLLTGRITHIARKRRSRRAARSRPVNEGTAT